MATFELDEEAVAELCRVFGVRRLSVFGSATTPGFDAATSDVDFIVEFDDDVGSAFDAYFGSRKRWNAWWADRSTW